MLSKLFYYRSVDESGVVTAISNGITSIVIESAGCKTITEVIVGEAKYVLNPSLCEEMHTQSEPYEFNCGDYTWLSDGRFYYSNWNNAPSLYSEYGKLENVTPINGVTKIMITYYTDPSDASSSYIDGRVSLMAGATKDAMVKLIANQQNVYSEETEFATYDGRAIRKYVATYTIPEGCSYFCLDFNNCFWGPLGPVAFF